MSPIILFSLLTLCYCAFTVQNDVSPDSNNPPEQNRLQIPGRQCQNFGSCCQQMKDFCPIHPNCKAEVKARKKRGAGKKKANRKRSYHGMNGKNRGKVNGKRSSHGKSSSSSGSIGSSESIRRNSGASQLFAKLEELRRMQSELPSEVEEEVEGVESARTNQRAIPRGVKLVDSSLIGRMCPEACELCHAGEEVEEPSLCDRNSFELLCGPSAVCEEPLADPENLQTPWMPSDTAELEAIEKAVEAQADCRDLQDLAHIDCAAIKTLLPHAKTGQYVVRLEAEAGVGSSSYCIRVTCDMDTKGGGWTVIQKRSKGDVEFQKSWMEYEDGFGNSQTFWLGLKHQKSLTQKSKQELWVRLGKADATLPGLFAHYGVFSVGGEKYQLGIGEYQGGTLLEQTALLYHNGMNFTTMDQDNDDYRDGNCAAHQKVGITGGWWYKHCFKVNLNGRYQQGEVGYASGIHWVDEEGPGSGSGTGLLHFSYSSSLMMARSISFKGEDKRILPEDPTCYLLESEGDVDCAAIHARNPSAASGMYTIKTRKVEACGGDTKCCGRVYCFMDFEHISVRGWTAIQRRTTKFRTFFDSFRKLEAGVGDEENLWTGLTHIRALTEGQEYVLVVLLFPEGSSLPQAAVYSKFAVEGDDYSLKVNGFLGAGLEDGLSGQSGFKFASYRHNDDRNCAKTRRNPWWYADCNGTALNGIFHNDVPNSGIMWQANGSEKQIFNKSVMVIRKLSQAEKASLFGEMQKIAAILPSYT